MTQAIIVDWCKVRRLRIRLADLGSELAVLDAVKDTVVSYRDHPSGYLRAAQARRLTYLAIDRAKVWRKYQSVKLRYKRSVSGGVY